ncbi:MAG: ADP-ribosylglycohydrolase family protein [Anaerolineaceae bacterium]
MKKAWQIDREMRENAIPIDRRVQSSNWYEAGFEVPYGDALIDLFWESKVPGSSAPEITYVSMVQAMGNKGYDVSAAEQFLEEGMSLHAQGKKEELRVITAKVLNALKNAQFDLSEKYHSFQHPDSWEDVQKCMGDISSVATNKDWKKQYADQIYKGWIGQLAGGSFGTCIEGYTGKRIAEVYGKIDGYLSQPETKNDDVVYELAFLDAYEKLGKKITPEAIAMEWVRQVPFGWSAEWVALRNLNMGIFPPESGVWFNPYSEWIGAQMRGMVCGMIAPAQPLEAARLAHLDGVISHSKNGVYGEIFAAVLTALAFEMDDIHTLIEAGMKFIPQKSQYYAIVNNALDKIKKGGEPAQIWSGIEEELKRYNWIHAYPNIAAVLFALWLGEGDFTKSLSLLAVAGMDVDCNGGLVGNILGIMKGVPVQWSEPIGDLLETYILGKEKLSIRELADKTACLAEHTWNAVI